MRSIKVSLTRCTEQKWSVPPSTHLTSTLTTHTSNLQLLGSQHVHVPIRRRLRRPRHDTTRVPRRQPPTPKERQTTSSSHSLPRPTRRRQRIHDLYNTPTPILVTITRLCRSTPRRERVCAAAGTAHGGRGVEDALR
jgi:hypothetical protein